MIYQNFAVACTDIERRFRTTASQVKANQWQSVDVSRKPEMSTYELLDLSLQIVLPTENLDHYRDDIRPNLPWADHHFEQERISSEPINPGVTWKDWPWGHSAGNFLNENKQFSHTYAERYWPRYAGHTGDGRLTDLEENPDGRKGIRFPYGDLMDVVTLLDSDPNTRQAVLPVWFPEDTGVVHKQRVPCSISYVFTHRFGYLHTFYHIRSCDYIRHFQDDCYLTVRLMLWILERLRNRNPERWNAVRPGRYTMHINSLHMFVNDYAKLAPKP